MSARTGFLAAAMALAVACAGGSGAGRVIVLALDGVDPHTIDLLLSEDKLPNVARLRREGAYGRLRSARPLLSPVVWTTIATGKTPDHHGIGYFVAVDQATGEQLPVTSRMRRVKAIWNILSEADRSVAVVGWWATWPPEHVRGAMVSDHLAYHFLLNDGAAPANGGTEIVYPPALGRRLEPCVQVPADLTLERVRPFVTVTSGELSRPFQFQDDLSHFKWALAAAETHRCVGLQLWEEERPSALLVYIEGVDSVSHLFGHLFRAENLAGELREQQARYGRAVEQMYVHIDAVVGEYLRVLDSETTLMVLSDHGFELGAVPEDPSKTRDMRRVSEAHHRLDGILYLYGHHVRSRGRIQNATLLDITPTLLTLLGLPPAKDMPGRVLEEALTVEAPARVGSYERGDAPQAPAADRDPVADREALERLRSLGYVSTSSPAGDANLAALAFEAGRYAEAVGAYEQLIRASPRDGALRASLAGALGALERYDEAIEQLSLAIELQPLNIEAYHNRAAIHERRGNVAGALRDYQTAIRYNPQYEPSLRALRRLGVTPSSGAPRTNAEERAWRLAEAASDDARRGRYAEAMRKLDEAVALAPRYAILYQYRSNVAYLMGDRAAAIAALKRGLELEPANALFRENLARLQAPPSAARPR